LSSFFKSLIRAISGFLQNKTKSRLLFLFIICIVALAEFTVLGIARRTFVFYTIDNGVLVVEDRMLKRSSSRETNLTRYIEEALLGPVSPVLLPLFPRDTKLRSLLFRNGVAYIDFSIAAALPPEEGGESLINFRTLYGGILRNFPYVKEVRFFVNGNAAFATELGYKES